MKAATLAEFAKANDAAAGTPKRTEKQRILAEYFRALGDEDLKRAARWVAGERVPVLNVGWALVSRVLLELLGLEAGAYHELVVRSGEIGEAVARAWKNRDGEPSLTLEEIERGFDELAGTGNTERKRAILRRLLSQCAYAREAAYLCKLIFREMRTGVQRGVALFAIAEAFGREPATVRKCLLLLGDLGELAVKARHDQLGCAEFELFRPIQFMLATAQEDSKQAAETMGVRTFLAEDKLDGIRAQVHKRGARVEIYTRTMEQCADGFPEVVEAARKVPGEFLLDGEIVPYREGKVLPFAHIQTRLGRKALDRRVIAENPIRFVAFDALYVDGEMLMDRPLQERRRRLEELLRGTEALLVTRAIEVRTTEEIDAAFCNARDCRNEGLMLKDPESAYLPGRRGRAWLKIKTHLPTLDCVVTAVETGHGKRRNWLSDYTFAVWDREPGEPGARLVNVGKAYSGLTEVEIIELTELFTRTMIAQHGRVRIVEPRIVLEIACDQIQKSNRHASGYALRFPRIKRIRHDKRPEDADRLSRVVEIYQSPANFGKREISTESSIDPQLELFDAQSPG